MSKYVLSAKTIVLGSGAIIPLVFCTLLLGMCYLGVKSQGERAIHATVAATNEALATNIYEQYRDTIAEVIRKHTEHEATSYGFDDKGAPIAENIQLIFDMRLHNIVLSTAVFDLHIFAPDGHLVWDSGDSSHPGKPHQPNEYLTQALSGVPASAIEQENLKSGHILNKSETRMTAVTYMPLFDIRRRQIGVLEIYSHVDNAIVAAIGGVRNMTAIVLTAFLLCFALTLVTLFRHGQNSKTWRLAEQDTPNTTKTLSNVALMFRLGGGASLGALLSVVLLGAK